MQGNPLSHRPISLWTGFKFSASPNQRLRFVVYHLTLVLVLDIWLLFRNIALRTLSAKFPSYNSSTSLVELELADTAIPPFNASYTLLEWSILPEDIGVVRTSAPPRWVQRESGGLVLLQERWWCHAMVLGVKTEGEVAGWRETMNGRGMEDRRSEISSEGSKAVTLFRRASTRPAVSVKQLRSHGWAFHSPSTALASCEADRYGARRHIEGPGEREKEEGLPASITVKRRVV